MEIFHAGNSTCMEKVSSAFFVRAVTTAEMKPRASAPQREATNRLLFIYRLIFKPIPFALINYSFNGVYFNLFVCLFLLIDQLQYNIISLPLLYNIIIL